MKKSQQILGSICLLSLVSCLVYVSVKWWNNDTKPPYFQLEEESLCISAEELQSGEAVLLQNMRAEDDRDGDLTDHILVERIRKKQGGAENEYEAGYIVYDQAGNLARTVRTLTISDYQKARFHTKHSFRYPKGQKVDLRGEFTVWDFYDGVISSRIVYDMPAELAMGEADCGWYDCTAKVTNRLGDEIKLCFSIEVYDPSEEENESAVKLSLTEHVIYMQKNEVFHPEAYLKNVQDNGVIYQFVKDIEEESQKPGNWIDTRAVSFESDINPTVSGSYTGVYTYVSNITGYTAKENVYIVVE